MDIDELIAVLEAIKAGDPIECRHGNNWIAGGTNIRFICEAIGKGFEYRPKPKPRVVYINEYCTGLGRAHESRELADDFESDRIACRQFIENMDYEG